MLNYILVRFSSEIPAEKRLAQTSNQNNRGKVDNVIQMWFLSILDNICELKFIINGRSKIIQYNAVHNLIN